MTGNGRQERAEAGASGQEPKRLRVARIIQEKFFPWPPTRWETMAPHQQQDFLECADEILAALKPSAR